MHHFAKILPAIFLAPFFALGCVSPPPAPTPAVADPQPLLSEAPIPELFPLTTQEKIQAVYHWDLIAADIADQAKKALETRYPGRVRAIYVAPCGATPFGKVFRALLITRLFETGLSISNDAADNLVLSFDVELVRHPRRMIGIDGGGYRPVAQGLLAKSGDAGLQDPGARPDADPKGKVNRLDDLGENTKVFLPENEVIITTSLTQNGSYIVRDSSIYYIDDPEWWQYVQKADVTYPSAPHYTLTDR